MADLPININAIGQQEGYDDALTARYEIELFSDESEGVNENIVIENQRKRDTVKDDLFKGSFYGGTVDIKQTVTEKAEALSLFNEPAAFVGLSDSSGIAGISVWLIILVLAISAAGGFLWALMSLSGKRRREADVY